MLPFSKPRSGFSLIEIIVALALIALVAGLFVGNLESILQGLGPDPIDQQLHKAVQEARYHAAARKEGVRLRYDADAAAFILETETGTEIEQRPTGYDPKTESIEISFFQRLPGRGLRGTQRSEQVPINAVRFLPDRSSTPFSAEIRTDQDRLLKHYDPFSDLELAARN